MPQIQTCNLNDRALDWAVTLLEEPEALRYGVADWLEQRRSAVVRGEYKHRYHQSWAQSGPIIEREKISPWITTSDGFWKAAPLAYMDGDISIMDSTGPTLLIAAMRCYVASKLGDSINIPEELQ